MGNGYLLAHDLGTSGNKAVLFDAGGGLVASVFRPYPTLYPREGWVEQRPDDWWIAVCGATRSLLEISAVRSADVLCVSFSAQMMGCLLVGRDGSPLRNTMIWADSRAQRQEAGMIARAGMKRGYHITGHRLSASYSAAKLLWVRDEEPEVYQAASKMLQAKDYILYRMTGNLLTDYSDASGTNLLDIERKDWSDELLEAFALRRDLLPELHPSTDLAGTVTAQAARECGLLPGTPVVVGGGDGSCACVGAGVLRPGSAYNVIGTSSWISCATRAPYFDPEMRTFNWVHLDPALYTPCGTMQAAGLSYQWYKNSFYGEEEARAQREGRNVYELLDAGAEAASPGAGGVIFLPYLVGERSPHWNLNARGAFIGLNATTGKTHLARAVLEGVGMNLRIILETLDAAQRIDALTVIGGGAKGRTWLQILADIWQRPLSIPAHMEEATSLGAAICGGVGIGLYESFASCVDLNPMAGRILPNPDNREAYDMLFAVFQQSYGGLVPALDQLSGWRRYAEKKEGSQCLR